MARRRRRLLGTTLASALLVSGLALGTSSEVQAATPPTRPRDVAVEPKAGAVKVAWLAPSGTGGAPVDKYKVVRWAVDIPRTSYVINAPTRSFVVPDLIDGTPYFFTVAAHNSAGWGPASAKISATPRTVPTAPLALQAVLDNRTADLTWTPPSSDGGASISGYRLERSADGSAWSTTASPLTTQASVSQLDYGVDYRFRVRALNAAGVSRPSNVAKVTPVLPECPDPLPAVGPYLELSCDAADGIVVRTCTNPDWKDLNGVAEDGCEAARQMPLFVPGNSVGDDAATAYADRLSGSFWLTGYPGDREPENYWEVDPILVPFSASCGGSPSWGCPGNTPQDPMPSLRLDFKPAPGDSPRRAVANVTGQSRFDITYRARVVTTDPVAFSYSGSDCMLEVDSTSGAVPDLTITFSVDFPNFAWHQHGNLNSLHVADLEDSDWDLIGGFACDVAPTPSDAILTVVSETLDAHFADKVLSTCGAVDPYWWQDCRPIAEEPPEAPTPPEPVPSCPDAPPPAGPYMTTGCDPTTGTLVKTCDSGWRDRNGLVPDGCERRAGGLAEMQLDDTTAESLADRISGSFYLGGYPGDAGDTGTGPLYVAPNPQRQPLPACSGNIWGCFNDAPQSPMPDLVLDFSLQPGDHPRAVGQHDENQTATFVHLRNRLTTSGAIALPINGVGCEFSIDTSRGLSDEMVLIIAAQGSGNGPLQVSGVLPDSLVDLEDEDIVVGPHRWCRYYGQGFIRSTVRSWIGEHLVAWAARQGRLCGAPSPYFWQGCP